MLSVLAGKLHMMSTARSTARLFAKMLRIIALLSYRIPLQTEPLSCITSCRLPWACIADRNAEPVLLHESRRKPTRGTARKALAS